MGAATAAGLVIRPLPAPWPLTGWLLFALGFGLTFLAARQFRLARTNINTFEAPGTLVTTGLFAVSRNPMYLGFTLALLGAAIGLNNAWALIPAVIFFLVAALHYIPYEERAAAAIFGEAYTAYCRRVRRWI
ncbi:isoprenylcysteine carboxyl methyltransferase [Hyphomonas polymorpha PS728]|uniref:Isoprenylcysteine carboxyl methyltransferase n=2 Tax=Hyphomonas polymorpha TaxID=74319 RepID=A0A062VF61_9PROT|nr:isoprenylcysteine carboxyl methyltransferase [Hyphomonas polymorpha PS728]